MSITHKMARIACDIVEAWAEPHEFEEIKRGENPHDFMDANIALYGAFAGVMFQEADAGNQKHADLMNDAWHLCQLAVWDRNELRKMEEAL